MAPADKDRKAALKVIADALLALDEKRRYRKIDFFTPYPKQQIFFDMGATFRERLFSAGNQMGKTEAGAVETVYHLTGDYPVDWLGKRFDKPIKTWCAGVSSLAVRDGPQVKLCGEFGLDIALGSGYIPKASIVGKPSLARGVTDAFDTVHVRHKSGGVSTLTFKSYEQGRAKFQGVPVDLIWLDEECPEDIYTECIARTKATRGPIYTTFTPHLGFTNVYNRFTRENDGSRGFVNMTIYDVPGLTPEQIKEDIAMYPIHERETRTKGTPSMAQGRIFTTPEESIREKMIDHLPLHWYKLWGCDFGIDHPFAAVLIAWDKDTDTIHVIHAVKMADAIPVVHAAPMKAYAGDVPVAWPQDGTKRESSGEVVASQYRKAGLKMLHEHSTFPEGGYSTEAGILEMNDRFQTGRLKIAEQLADLFDEYRMYHRKDGLIVKLNDDLLSALRQTIMMKRYAKQGPIGPTRFRRPRSPNDPALMMDHAELSGRDLF